MSLYNNDLATWLGVWMCVSKVMDALALVLNADVVRNGWAGCKRLIDRPSVLGDGCECIRGRAAHRLAQVVVWADDHRRDGSPPRRRYSSTRFAHPQARRRQQRHVHPMGYPPPAPECHCWSHRQTGNCPPHRMHHSGSCVSVRPCWCCRRRRSRWEQNTAAAMKMPPISLELELGNSWGSLTYLNMLRISVDDVECLLRLCVCLKEDAWVATDCHGPVRCGFYMPWIRSAKLWGKRVSLGFPLLIAAIGNNSIYYKVHGRRGQQQWVAIIAKNRIIIIETLTTTTTTTATIPLKAMSHLPAIYFGFGVSFAFAFLLQLFLNFVFLFIFTLNF